MNAPTPRRGPALENATVISPAKVNGARAPVISDPSGVAAEAIRALRTHVMAQHVHSGRRGLAICAASSGVGCTFIAVNLAIAMSQAGLNTLLVDGNLREPGVQKLLPVEGDPPGLAACLADPGSFISDFIENDVLPGLSVMYAGGPVANAQELLSGDRFETVMNACLRDFDITLVDTPPANLCADVERISTVVGYSLVVARKNRTMVRDVKVLIDQLRTDHANVVGTVLNNG
jgi:capsular exopolysaccharide synthesis family protein